MQKNEYYKNKPYDKMPLLILIIFMVRNSLLNQDWERCNESNECYEQSYYCMDVNIESPKLVHGKEYRNVNHKSPHIWHKLFMIYLKCLDGALFFHLLFGLLKNSCNRINVLHVNIIKCWDFIDITTKNHSKATFHL